MTYVMVRHKVKDYRKWKKAVQNHADMRKSAATRTCSGLQNMNISGF